MATDGFMPQQGNYRKLRAYQKAECIYDVTYYFAHHYLVKGDRTVDQMVQAARSGKQNIAEGSAAATTSRETEIKLYNVAKASLLELLEDYEDYLRVRELERWPKDSPKAMQTRLVCRQHSDSAFFRERIKVRLAETIANIAIILLHQTDYLMERLVESAKRRFLEKGGIREEMTRARLEYRRREEGRAGRTGERTGSSGRPGRPGSSGSSGKDGIT